MLKSVLTLQKEFHKQVNYIKEQQRAREEEIQGGWCTTERMSQDLGFSTFLVEDLVCVLNDAALSFSFFML